MPRRAEEAEGVAVVAAQQPPAQQGGQQPSFRAGIELVSLNVTVTDPSAHYITDLNQEEFQVFEDGVKQEVTLFNHSNLPIALALLLDTSASMEARLTTAQEAAIGFARLMSDSRRSRRVVNGDAALAAASSLYAARKSPTSLPGSSPSRSVLAM